MAAAPVVSATSLAGSLGMAVKNAARLLEAFVERGVAIAVTQRSKRRLYGLKHLAPLREEAAPPRRPMPGRGSKLRAAASAASKLGRSSSLRSTMLIQSLAFRSLCRGRRRRSQARVIATYQRRTRSWRSWSLSAALITSRPKYYLCLMCLTLSLPCSGEA
jgi:hypothetical protein